MHADAELSARQPAGDPFGLVLVLMLGVTFATGIAVGRASIMGRGRERKLRERAEQTAPALSAYTRKILAFCEATIRDEYDTDFNDLDKHVRDKIAEAVIDAEKGGGEVMRFAAIAEYRNQKKLQRYARETQGDDDAS